MIFFVMNCNFCVNRITDKYRTDKAKMIISIRKCDRIDHICSRTYSYTESQSSMGDPFPEFCCFCKFGIHMMREEIPCLTCM